MLSVTRQSQSRNSIQSSLGSDLRATAPEFVPRAAPRISSGSFSAHGTIAAQLKQATDSIDLFGLDTHGIPWMYYMYPIHFAYEQGFRNGRLRSPKKYKQKKLGASVTSPNQNHQPKYDAPGIQAKGLTASLSERPYDQASENLMPLPSVPMHQQGSVKQENSQPCLPPHGIETNSHIEGPNPPFSDQINMITQQTRLCDLTNNNMFRTSNVDLTMIQNVGLPNGPQNMHSSKHYKVPRNYHRGARRYTGNGLYGGRGTVGLPMEATVPFPDPVPPPGRPGQGAFRNGSPRQNLSNTVGTEACGRIDILMAAERGGGEACNACAPDH